MPQAVTTNIAQVLATLDMAEQDIFEAVGKAVMQGVNDMENDVRTNAPKSGDITPKIHGGGKTVDYNIGSYTFKNFSNSNANAEFGISGEASDLAAYIEFGTGTDATGYVPSLEDDFQRQALQFYKNGKGSLAHVPFFLPAWYRVRDRIVSDAQTNINNIKL